MSKLDDPKRREMLRAWAIGERYNKVAAINALDDKAALYPWIVGHIGADTAVDYLEFGVADGNSMKVFCEGFRNPASSFTGFDSFEGLPEAWLHLPQFHFGRRGEAPAIADPRLTFVKGWFQNTIPEFLKTWRGGTSVALVHYDADLYSSTLFALTMLWPHLPAYYFLMDDFTHDDAVALFDFESSYPIRIEFLAQAGRDANGRAIPSKVFGRIRNCHYEPQV